MASTITLANTITWAKGFAFNIDPTLNTGSEPALTSANLIKLTMLNPPFTWRWNRFLTGFVSAVGVQDYLLRNWATGTAYAVNDLVVDTYGNSQQVTTAGTSGGGAPTWNVNVGGFTTDNTVTWKNLGSIISTAANGYTLGFIENVSALDIGQNPNKWYEMSPKVCLGLDSSQARPLHIAAQKDDGAGNITFRVMPTPAKAYPIAITLQQKPALFTATSGTWSPIPDEYSYIYNWGFLTLLLMYNDDPKWIAANQKFVSSLLSAQQGLTETERNIFLANWEAVLGQQAANTMKIQQGTQARGM